MLHDRIVLVISVHTDPRAANYCMDPIGFDPIIGDEAVQHCGRVLCSVLTNKQKQQPFVSRLRRLGGAKSIFATIFIQSLWPHMPLRRVRLINSPLITRMCPNSGEHCQQRMKFHHLRPNHPRRNRKRSFFLVRLRSFATTTVVWRLNAVAFLARYPSCWLVLLRSMTKPEFL